MRRKVVWGANFIIKIFLSWKFLGKTLWLDSLQQQRKIVWKIRIIMIQLWNIYETLWCIHVLRKVYSFGNFSSGKLFMNLHLQLGYDFDSIFRISHQTLNSKLSNVPIIYSSTLRCIYWTKNQSIDELFLFLFSSTPCLC